MSTTTSAARIGVHLVAAIMFALPALAHAQQEVTSKMQPKIDAYKKKVSAWAADVGSPGTELEFAL